MTERFAFVYVLPFSFRYVVVQKIDYIFNKCFFHNSQILDKKKRSTIADASRGRQYARDGALQVTYGTSAVAFLSFKFAAAARVTTARWCLGFGIGSFLRRAVVHLHGLFVQCELVAELAANAGTESPLDSVGCQHVLGGNGRAVVLVGVRLNLLVAD